MHKVILTNRDMDMIRFLWRWKLLSTAALTEAFFRGLSPVTAYTRIWHLTQAGFLQPIGDREGRRFVWALGQKGFAAIQNELPELLESGFKSENVGHDTLVTAFHLGDWLGGIPTGAECFTEQELRRYHGDHYPDWVPMTKDHRPDGYTRIHKNGKWITFAFEVEINQKRNRFYQNVAHFYDRLDSISRILWLVPTPHLAEKIRSLIQNEVRERQRIHCFVARRDFEKDGWAAQILLGNEAGKPVSYLLEPVQTSPKPVWTTFLLDTRKCPHRSTRYRKLPPPSFPDRDGAALQIEEGGAH